MPIALITRTSIKGTLTTPRDGGDATFTVDTGASNEVSNGTGIDQANAIYEDDFSIAASGTLSIDLASTLTDPNNNVIVLTAVKEIYIKADDANVNSIIVGNGATPFLGGFGLAAHTWTIPPGGFFHVSEGYSAAGWPVGAGTADVLKLANSGAGTAVTGRIIVIGEA